MQAVARGEATLDSTVAAFLGRLDPALRTRAIAPAPAALGRRLQQANNYLVQAGKHGYAHQRIVVSCLPSASGERLKRTQAPHGSLHILLSLSDPALSSEDSITGSIVSEKVWHMEDFTSSSATGSPLKASVHDTHWDFTQPADT